MAEIGHAMAGAAAPIFPVRLRPGPFELPKNALSSSLTREQQRLLLPYMKQRRMKAGRTIIEEGARSNGKVYILIDGQVSVSKEGFSPVEHRMVSYEIAVLRRGDIFGEVAFVSGMPSAATFVAKSAVRIAVVDLSSSLRNKTVKRLRTIVATKLRGYLASQAYNSATAQLNSLQIQNEFVSYRSGVGHIIVTALCTLSFYTLTLSFLPNFQSLAHANFALTPLIILLFAGSFVPIIATSGFPMRFFGLSFENWRPALAFSLQVSAIFLLFLLILKWIVIHSTSTFHDLPLIDGAKVEIGGQAVSMSAWYWLALFIYVLLTPMQEFVARSAIQAPLYAFLHGSETKRRWCSIAASNLVFAAAHAHISLPFALAAFLPGILWGWIFARTNSLLAATVSHLLVGGIAIFFFGIEGIVAKLAG